MKRQLQRVLVLLFVIMFIPPPITFNSITPKAYASETEAAATVEESAGESEAALTEEAEGSAADSSDTTDDRPTDAPTDQPTDAPTDQPTDAPTDQPTDAPTDQPTDAPTDQPTDTPTEQPAEQPEEPPLDETDEQEAEPTEPPLEETGEQPPEAETDTVIDESTITPEIEDSALLAAEGAPAAPSVRAPNYYADGTVEIRIYGNDSSDGHELYFKNGDSLTLVYAITEDPWNATYSAKNAALGQYCAKSYKIVDGARVYSNVSNTITVQAVTSFPEAPQPTLEGDILSWEPVSGAMRYSVVQYYTTSRYEYTVSVGTETSTTVPLTDSSDYTFISFAVRGEDTLMNDPDSNGISSLSTLYGNWSEEIVYVEMVPGTPDAPYLYGPSYHADGTVSISMSGSGDGIVLYRENGQSDIMVAERAEFSWTYESKNIPLGRYYAKAYNLVDGNRVYSPASNKKEVIAISSYPATPSLSLSGSTLSWNAVSGSEGYVIIEYQSPEREDNLYRRRNSKFINAGDNITQLTVPFEGTAENYDYLSYSIQCYTYNENANWDSVYSEWSPEAVYLDRRNEKPRTPTLGLEYRHPGTSIMLEIGSGEAVAAREIYSVESGGDKLVRTVTETNTGGISAPAQKGTKYYMLAYNLVNGEKLYSDKSNIVTVGEITKWPDAPTPSISGNILSWNSISGATGYRVMQSTSASSQSYGWTDQTNTQTVIPLWSPESEFLAYRVAAIAVHTDGYNVVGPNSAEIVYRGERPAPSAPTSVGLSPYGDAATIPLGANVTLVPTLTPSNATTTYTWKTSDTKIATVAGGVVTPKKVGKVTITVTTANDKTAKIVFTIFDPAKPTSVTLSPGGTISLEVGATVALVPSLSPAGSYTTYKWSSSSTAAATVDDGIVTARKAGKATITVKTANSKTAKVTVNVTDSYKPQTITLSQSGTVYLDYGQTLLLTASVQPPQYQTTLSWSSSSKTIASVNANGLVTANAKKEGSATITVKSVYGKTAKVTIKVVNPAKVRSVSLNKTGTVQLRTDETLTLTPTVTPATASGAVTWSASPKGIVTVTDGVVKPLKEGKATVMVKTVSGGKTAKVTVQVIDPYKPTGITITTLTPVEVKVKETLALTYTLAPADARVTKVTWSSSSKTIATVDTNGVVTGKKAGTATITVKTPNGKSAKIKIKVVK